ncbi:MAG: NAD(P)H-hydrate dehydratase [Oscillospiraceae bacterium]|nr:NAD(P)H-hydrate dehydratase [Oscillospiraceae bacterium]
MRLSNSEKMYNADASAIHVAGIPSYILMQNAAAHIARAAAEIMGQNRTAVVFCGTGNNGGDGVGAAAILCQQGVRVRALLVGRREKMTHDSLRMEERLRAAGGELEPFDPQDASLPGELRRAGAVIDALFGIGLKRDLGGDALKDVRMMNASGAGVIAADIPSGVSADSGAVLGEAVKCVRTVTFSLAKPGHFLEPGCVYCGEVEVCDIGIPPETVKAAETDTEVILPGEIRLPKRPRVSHKGDFGKLLILGGSRGYTGAPNLCARAAVRSGAGLVYLGVPEAIYPICAVKNDEAMPFPLPCDREGRLTEEAVRLALARENAPDVIVAGPGMGRSEEIRKAVRLLLREAKVPLVLDADALWAVSDEVALLADYAYPLIITPHAGEFARLGGAITGERLCDARFFARQYGCITVLKGHRTVVAMPDGRAGIIAAGNPGMAKGGSGDVLAGVLGALLGQMEPERAALTACWVHADAGDECAAQKGEYGMTPSDIIEAIPTIMKEITE